MIPAQLIVGGFIEERIKIAQKLIQPFFGPIDFDNPPIDVLIITPEKSIGIDKIRALRKFLSRRPFQAKMKIGLILEAEKLTLPAQNSLLKTLEEPPENSLIILLTSRSKSLLPTILSRAKIIQLPAKSQIRLSDQETHQLAKNLNHLVTLEIGERLRLSFSLVQNKDQAMTLTENLLSLWRLFLRAKIGIQEKGPKFPDQLTLEQIKRATMNTEQIRKMLVANVNFHLAIDNLLLSYPYLKLASPSKN